MFNNTELNQVAYKYYSYYLLVQRDDPLHPYNSPVDANCSSLSKSKRLRYDGCVTGRIP